MPFPSTSATTVPSGSSSSPSPATPAATMPGSTPAPRRLLRPRLPGSIASGEYEEPQLPACSGARPRDGLTVLLLMSTAALLPPPPSPFRRPHVKPTTPCHIHGFGLLPVSILPGAAAAGAVRSRQPIAGDAEEAPQKLHKPVEQLCIRQGHGFCRALVQDVMSSYVQGASGSAPVWSLTRGKSRSRRANGRQYTSGEEEREGRGVERERAKGGV